MGRAAEKQNDSGPRSCWVSKIGSAHRSMGQQAVTKGGRGPRSLHFIDVSQAQRVFVATMINCIFSLKRRIGLSGDNAAPLLVLLGYCGMLHRLKIVQTSLVLSSVLPCPPSRRPFHPSRPSSSLVICSSCQRRESDLPDAMSVVI